MPQKRNPLNLNALQLRTLTLLQEMARLGGKQAAGKTPNPAASRLPRSARAWGSFPSRRGACRARHATGLRNPAVFAALERKGLIQPKSPEAVILTGGPGIRTGSRDTILRRVDQSAI